MFKISKIIENISCRKVCGLYICDTIMKVPHIVSKSKVRQTCRNPVCPGNVFNTIFSADTKTKIENCFSCPLTQEPDTTKPSSKIAIMNSGLHKQYLGDQQQCFCLRAGGLGAVIWYQGVRPIALGAAALSCWPNPTWSTWSTAQFWGRAIAENWKQGNYLSVQPFMEHQRC